MLIIQKEFDGFNNTNERLDLLALDKHGQLVMIENKLDDSGRDVVWQSLKYASYCSSLNKNQILDIYQRFLDKQGKSESATDNLVDFFGCKNDFNELQLNQGTSQRIIMIARKFRKEVTSTVLWLINYKLRIQCFKVTPFAHANNIFIDIEQIIPMQDAEEYLISMADKAQEDIITQENSKVRHGLRFEFWTRFLKELNKKSDIYRNISPSKDNWIGSGSGISSASYNSVISNRYARVELYISRASVEENKSIFDFLYAQKSSIETSFGSELVWERLDNKKACRIKFELGGVDYFNEGDWAKMIDFMIENLPKLSVAFNDVIKAASKKLKSLS